MKLLKLSTSHKDKLTYLVQMYMPEYKYICFTTGLEHHINIQLYKKKTLAIMYDGVTLPWYMFIMNHLIPVMALTQIIKDSDNVRYEEIIEDAVNMILIGGIHPVTYLLRQHFKYKREELNKKPQTDEKLKIK